VEENVTYLEVAEAVETYILDRGASIGFPVNIAVNDIAAHYTPRPGEKTRFKYGDLVKIDVGVHLDGCIGDTARTVEVGSDTFRQLSLASKRALESALEIVRGGISLSSIGAMVERTMNTMGFRPIVNLTGHSIERYNLHAGISVPNYDDRGNEFLPTGTILAIEPFSTTGVGEVVSYKRSNIYRFVRARSKLKEPLEQASRAVQDGSPKLPFSERWLEKRHPSCESALNGLVRAGAVYAYPILRETSGGMVAQWEHTVHVTERGCRVLTA
jgi:methionyl aminopeptidase